MLPILQHVTTKRILLDTKITDGSNKNKNWKPTMAYNEHRIRKRQTAKHGRSEINKCIKSNIKKMGRHDFLSVSRERRWISFTKVDNASPGLNKWAFVKYIQTNHIISLFTRHSFLTPHSAHYACLKKRFETSVCNRTSNTAFNPIGTNSNVERSRRTAYRMSRLPIRCASHC